jgi:hypothetical protein
MRLHGSGTIVALVTVAAIAAACGSNAKDSGFNSGGSSGGAGSGGGSGAGSGSGSGGITGDSGSLLGNDSGASSGGSSGGGKGLGCDATCQLAGGSCQSNVCVIVDNAGNVSSSTQGQLQAGGTGDANFKFLYPYDETVFPRGLIPPTMQFGGVAPNAEYVHITCDSLDYKGYFTPPQGPPALQLPAKDWTAILDAASGPNDPLHVEITKIANGIVAGPITETWPVAQGSLRGVLYYETYDSQLAGGLGSVGIMQIAPGATKPTVMKTGCGNVCHTASADGSTLVASQSLLSSASYNLKNNATAIQVAGDERFTYGGLYPDGSMAMSATHYRTWIPGAASLLYDTQTGMPVSGVNGWTITNGGTTAFSPDGQHIAFVHEDTNPSIISMMDFNKSTTTFSNLQDLATAPADAGWPAFTPDSKWVVYHSDTNAQFETDSGAMGDLWIVDTATKATARLDSLNGYSPNGSVYLPANDPTMNFAPTVLPEAVGGYFWTVFTSHRSYGNTLPTQQPGPDGADEYGKLWVAALDINAVDGKDASHPAFFLDGQELQADNLRGFWVLPPCRQNGNSCMSGDECCNGFCRSFEGGALSCTSSPGGCSNEYEKCTTAADCCNSDYQCIDGFCAQPAAQ